MSEIITNVRPAGSKIQKIIIDFDDPQIEGALQYQVEDRTGEGLDSFEVPFDYDVFKPSKFKMGIYGDKKASREIDYDLFLHAAGKREEDERTRQLEELRLGDPFLKKLSPDFFDFEKYKGQRFPVMQYADVTERDMFGNEPINSTDLSTANKGIWGWHGVRKLEFTVDGMLIMDDTQDFKQSGVLYWKQMDSALIPVIFEDHVIENRNRAEGSKRYYTVYCDTNALGDALEDSESRSPIFGGRLELNFTYARKKESWGFPVSVCVHDTRPGTKLEEKSKRVSIDFGTSSTCAAVRVGADPKLFTLSGPEKTRKNEKDKRYENPTNLMIYNWEEVRNQWQNENPDHPLLLTKSNIFESDDVDYDSGYSVDEEFKDVDDAEGRKKMKAIITDLKNITSQLMQGNERKFIPLNDRNRAAKSVTDDLDAENDSKFNPIRFYGYLLGRIINNPDQKNFYTGYDISFPVKFDSAVRERIRVALADGILRSLPAKIRETLDPRDPNGAVKMSYEESVASIGAIIPDQLSKGDNDEAKMFAIFDLGGGTLDTSFGILRSARGEELDEADDTIQLLGIGGDVRAGGERLIHRLAFKIYIDNKEEMERENISFILPDGVPLPNEFEERLLCRPGDPIAESNLYTVMENLARYLFKEDKPVDGRMGDLFDRDRAPGGNQFKLKLRNRNDEEKEFTLEIKNVDDFLQEEIMKIIANFKGEMENVFKRNRQAREQAGLPDEFQVEDVAIYLGGNASQQYLVTELMESAFPDNEIKRIGDTEKEREKHESERLTGKTAVAFGQLNLGDYFIDRSAFEVGGPESKGAAPFPYNVGYRNNKGQFVKVIEKGDNSLEWKKANRLHKDTDHTMLFYSSHFDCDNSKNLEEHSEQLYPFERNQRTLYLRVYPNETAALEYRLGTQDSQFSADEEPDENRVLRLKPV